MTECGVTMSLEKQTLYRLIESTATDRKKTFSGEFDSPGESAAQTLVIVASTELSHLLLSFGCWRVHSQRRATVYLG